MSEHLQNPHIGKFVRSSANDYGIGKILDSNAQTAVVEYFDTPIAQDRFEDAVPFNSLEQVELGRQTRVYFLDLQLGNWRMGRVQGHVDHDQPGGGFIFISLPNKETARVPATELYARWAKPLQAPWEHLQAKLTESPYFHSSRHLLVSHLIKQRASSMGMTGLISSPVEIEQHQVEIVRRVLTDPVKRYLLADEVGLGKTIEAGIILRQHILDHPNSHSILIVVPEGLLKQWNDELRTRCQIGPHFGHEIEFVSHEEVAQWDDYPLDFIVVDEAHQITSGPTFDRIKSLSAPDQCQGLLLLSATPVLGNEAGFLGLLHLLDPAVYKLEDLEGFQTRLKKRQSLADIFATFTPETAPFFLKSLATQLGELFPDDARLQNMLSVLNPLLDEERDSFDSNALERQVRRLRMHISETYRLHRRILRNRRGKTTQEVVTGRRKYTRLPWDNLAQSRIEGILERWRAKAIESVWGDTKGSSRTRELESIFKILLESAWCDWMALILSSEIRLGNADRRWAPEFGPIVSPEKGELLSEIPLFDGEQSILEEIVQMTASLTTNRKEYLSKVAEAVRALRKNKFHVVCFATSPALADDLFRVMQLSKAGGVARHSLDNSDWNEQWDSGSADVLICDYRAEEGLNLHGNNSCMLHLDFPFSPNRLEQRIGRLDRFGKGKPVNSFAFHRRDSPYWEKWETCLNSAWRVFERSIASLQYVVEEEMETLLQQMFEMGETAIDSASERLTGEDGRIETEWRDIRNQDDLDSLEVEAGGNGEDHWVEDIRDYDESANEFQSALEHWIVDLLHFRKKEQDGVKNGPVQYQYRNTDNGPQTLMPLSDLLKFFPAAIEDWTKHGGDIKAVTPPLAFQRPKATNRSVDIGRLGNRVIEAVRNHLAWDDRGMCFALWRQTQATEKIEGKTCLASVYFRFDFVVEAALPHTLAESIKRKADGLFRPAIETIWLDQDLLPPDKEVLSILELSYSEEDINIRQEFWPFVLPALDTTDWGDLCEAAKRKAEQDTRKRLSLEEKIATAQKRHEIGIALVLEQLRSRIDAIGEDNRAGKLALEQDLSEVQEQALIISDSIKNPSMRLDACGSVFLSKVPFSEVMVQP